MILLKTYSITTDRSGQLVNPWILYEEINQASIISWLSHIDVEWDDIKVYGTSMDNESALDSLISWHVYAQQVNHEQFDIQIPNGWQQVISHRADNNYRRITQVFYKDSQLENLAEWASPYDPEGFSSLDERINDGSLRTVWSNNLVTPSSDKWIWLDFWTPTTIDKVEILWRTASRIATQYRIDHSDDWTNWTLWNVETGNYGSGSQEIIFSPITARYFRFYCVTWQNNNRVMVRELRMFDVQGTPEKWHHVNNTVYLSPTETLITNETWEDRDMRVNILYW